MFHQQLIILRKIFQKNDYLENYLDRCFKLFLNKIHILKEKVPTIEKKPLWSVLPYLGTISLQTTTKLQNSIKRLLNCCKIQVTLKVKIKPVIIFVLKMLFPKFLHQVWVISFSVDCGMNPIMEDVLFILL